MRYENSQLLTAWRNGVLGYCVLNFDAGQHRRKSHRHRSTASLKRATGLAARGALRGSQDGAPVSYALEQGAPGPGATDVVEEGRLLVEVYRVLIPLLAHGPEDDAPYDVDVLLRRRAPAVRGA